jgi:ribosome biogenesis GTPase
VVLRHEGTAVVVDCDGREVKCVVRKTLRTRGGGALRKAVAVGDRVLFEGGDDEGAVVGVEERRNAISRRDPSRPRREQAIVANLDAVLVVASARRPDFVPGPVDRFLVAAESRGLDAAVVVNKVDLDPGRAYLPFLEVYRGLGYQGLECSAATGEGFDALRAVLKDKTTTMLGHSGVGKSSLANALDPALALRTSSVNVETGLGRHTTTTVRLLRLPWGGYLVDTPGIREFGLWETDPHDVGVWFREIAAVQERCRFSNCLHDREPACAVKAAVGDRAIAPWRYESYLRILQSLRDDVPEPW